MSVSVALVADTLASAAWNGDLEQVKHWLSPEVVNLPNQRSMTNCSHSLTIDQTALYCAARNGHSHVVLGMSCLTLIYVKNCVIALPLTSTSR